MNHSMGEVRLCEVRTYSRQRGMSAQQFKFLAQDALILAVSRLVQGIVRERLCDFVFTQKNLILEGHTDLGCRLVLPCKRLLYGRLEATALPYLQIDERQTVLCSAGAFIRAIVRLLPIFSDEQLKENFCSDFQNSYANLLLNRVLVHGQLKMQAPEPAYQGHHTYPFPALRKGPALNELVACSHLNQKPIAIPLVSLGELIQTTTGELDLYHDALGLSDFAQNAPNGQKFHGLALLPIHPWQLTISPVLRHLLSSNKAQLTDYSVLAWPLASQRTCRIVSTGYDIKLPVDADITGERRLLFRLNCRNATIVSTLIRTLAAQSDLHQVFTGQYDVATLCHPADVLAPTLAAIVRSPAKIAGLQCLPAINLWSGPLEAEHIVPKDLQGAEKFLSSYSKTLLHGPMQLLLCHGIATEPHLQNSIICFDNALPARLMLRDLDATVLDRERWEGSLQGRIDAETWHHMPSFEEGAMRTIYALFYGHLGCVIDFMVRSRGLCMQRASEWVDDIWYVLVRELVDGTEQLQLADDLLASRQVVRARLMTRLQRDSGLHFFNDNSRSF